MAGLAHVVALPPTTTSASSGDVRSALRGMALMRSKVLLVESSGHSSSSNPVKRTVAGTHQSSCWAMTSSNYIHFRSRKTRSVQLTSRSSSQHVVVNSSTGSARFAAPATTAHPGLLSERISSSLFCSCSGSSPVTSSSGSAALTNGQRLKHILGGSRSSSNSSIKGTTRRSISTAAAIDGFKLTHVSTTEMGSSRSRRRAESTPLVPSALGRGQSQPASDNWDVGDLRLDTNTGLDEMGDGSFGDESTGGEDLELTGFVATKLGDEQDVDSSSHNNSFAHNGHGDLQDDTRESGSESESDPSPSPWLSKRWGIVILCFFAFLLCNMDRVNMSIAILPMSAEYHWNPTTVGLVQSSFFWGYLLTQVAGGIWADSLGGKQVLGFGVIWWSLATIATPIAAKIGLPVLFFVRACMGIGEGVAMPAMNNLLSKWIPVGERSRSLALVYSGMYLGSVTGLGCSPTLIHKFGWPSVFFSFGSLGAIWFALWQQYAQSSPAEDPTLSDTERILILKSNKPREPIKTIPWGLLLSKAPVWALIICHFCHNWGTFILLTWMPTYYNQVLGFNLMESGLFSVLPWLTMAISANVGGWIADSLVSKGYTVTFVRKVMQSIGFLGPAFFLTQLSHITSPYMAVACMMASQGSDAFSQAGLYSNHQDIGPRYSGILLGLSNTAGVLAGVFGTAATGYILQHGSWDDVFKVAVGLYLFGTVVWNLFATGEQLFD